MVIVNDHYQTIGIVNNQGAFSLALKWSISFNFTEARNSEWQWHQLVHKQVCTSLQTDNHASTPMC